MHSKLFFDHFDFSKTSTTQNIVQRNARLAKPSSEKRFQAYGEASNSTVKPVVDIPIPVVADLAIAPDPEPVKGHTLDQAHLQRRRIFVHSDDEQSQLGVSAYKSLRTSVLKQMERLQSNNLMVVGPTQNVGKTLTAINIALAIARNQQKRVILVDLDLRSPSVHVELGFESNGDIVDVAEGRKKFHEVLMSPGVERLSVLPAKRRWEDSSERLVTSKMVALLKSLHSLKNTIIVYDTPPILGCDDVAAIAPMMGASLMVVRQNVTRRAELRNSISQLGAYVPSVGITVNASTEADFNSYYY